MAGQDNGGALGFPDFEVPGAFDVKDSPVRRNRKFQRIRGSVVENHFLVIGIDGRAGIGRFNARGKLDSSEEMGLKERFGETLGRMAASGVPGAATSVEVAPGDRMIKAERSARIGGFIQGGQDMNGRSRID